MRAVVLLLLAGCAGTPPPQRPGPVAPTDPAPPEVSVETIPGTPVTFEMVRVGPLWVGKTEVTWAEFETYYLTEETEEGIDAVARPSPSYHPHDRGWGRGRRPAVGLNRNAAEKYCAWLSRRTGKTYRLPTEAEWEAFCGPDADPPPDAVCGAERTEPTGGRAPNRYGLHDVLGNASEYCSGPEPVVRGGSWNDATVSCKSRVVVPEEWNATDPQRPKSEWWLADAPWTGFRLVRD